MTYVSQGSFAALTSALALAGVGETGLLEALPKGALICLCILLMGVVWFFVKRDATRYKDRFDKLELTTFQLAKDQITNGQFIALADIVRDVERRQTIVETKIGMHG